MNIEKIENRILEINEILNNENWDLIKSSSLLKERNEKEFLINKQNIYVSLRGDDKYYNAYQCKNFAEYIKKNGFNRYKPSDIDDIYFDKHSITIRLKSTAETDIKRFETSKEMFSFVVGFNECVNQLKVKRSC